MISQKKRFALKSKSLFHQPSSAIDSLYHFVGFQDNSPWKIDPRQLPPDNSDLVQSPCTSNSHAMQLPLRIIVRNSFCNVWFKLNVQIIFQPFLYLDLDLHVLMIYQNVQIPFLSLILLVEEKYFLPISLKLNKDFGKC